MNKTIIGGIRKVSARLLLLLLTFPAFAADILAFDDKKIAGIIRDSRGDVVADANVTLFTAQQATVASTKSDGQGRFTFDNIAQGSYLLVVGAPGFADRREAINTRLSDQEIEVTLEPRLDAETVTVTANTGLVESVENTTQQVNVINEEVIGERAKAVTAQIFKEEVGLHMQRTSPTVSGAFVRGLVGNKVNVFIDGVRYSTSAQRGGVGSFFNLVDASNLQAVEVLRGPNSAQYGSDALGGSIQYLARPPSLSETAQVNSRLSLFANTADAGFGSSLTTGYSSRKFGLLTNLTAHRSNTLRTGHERDSRNSLTRFFNLSSDLGIDDRIPDTAFTQYGGMLKLNFSPTTRDQFTASYMRSQIDGGKRWDQLLGGDGNLIADLRNFMLDFFYARYTRTDLGWLDTFSLTYSFNSQREERVNQGGNGNRNASINHEFERTNVNGVQAYANKQLGSRNNFLVGGDFYHEHIKAPSFGLNPTTNVATRRRGRVPDGAEYRSGGVYVQDVFDALPGKLRLIGSLRYSKYDYESRTENSPIVGGRRLWPDDSFDTDAVTFRAGTVITPLEGLSFVFNIARGLRAPHITDLGTLGLTGDGFEVAASDVAGLNGFVGSSAAASAVSTGLPVAQLEPESSLTYDFGVRFHNRRVDTDFAFFINDIDNNIQKQALILPQGAVGLRLGDQIISQQLANGTVFVPIAPATPVLVRANFDEARLYGFEHTFDLKLTSDWSVSTIFTAVHAEDKRTGLAPNIEGGTPPAEGYLKLRYAPAGSHFWVEPYIHAADRQTRLSSLDLGDRRIGAGRSRTSIASFFNNGARARGFVNAGPDGVAGNADDRLNATGETLAQIQDRVLGVGVNSSSLFTALSGYVTFNVRGGFRFAERHEIMIDFENLGDRNYRGISWGLDAPGRGVFVRYSTRF
jgi:hemoglobin/transferrin/lactoferrin receptor protein